MQNAFSSGTPPNTSSTSCRLSYTLISIITLLLIAFAAIVILFDVNRIETEMEKRLDNAIMFAENSLPTPLWNLDYMVVNDLDHIIFNYKTVYLYPTAEITGISFNDRKR